ncbi:general substrate transporter [Dactylonectria macrodidyma]|uniref:General substrate transporter n=1 Tax=Dactylonectria macrodidyma TaxID=307937 RepID=A0A9P9DSJ6_9HYPO|nr:general substrate transporter [Dactylonectria macrodidyma]
MAAGFTGERQFTWCSFFISLVISSGVLSFGYPTAILGTTFSQPSFLAYMGLVNGDGITTSRVQALIGATSGVYQGGAVVGILISIWVMDKFGRKACFVYAAILGVIGAVGDCAAQNMAMFIVFRFFAGAGAWSSLCISPVYISELAPPKLRGLFVGLTGVILMLGQAIASYMGLAFFSIQNGSSIQWRGPLGIQAIFPLISLVVAKWLPESPRWCLMNDQVERARNIVTGLHGKDEAAQDFALAEFYQMHKQAEFDRTLDASWWKCLRTPSYRRRFEMCCIYGFITQSTGLLVISAYGSALYGSLGYGAREQILFQCGYLTAAVVFNILGDLIVDAVGRKRLMLIGFVSCTIWMILETAMVAEFASPVPENPNKAGLAMAVAALYLYIAFYAPTIDTAGFVYYTEVFPNHLRAKGVSLAIFFSALADVAYLQAASTAFANIGWKFFLIFIIIPVIGTIYIALRFPETRGLPLEEVAMLFGDEDQVMVFSEDIQINHDSHKLRIRDRRGHDGTTDASDDSAKRSRLAAEQIEVAYT